MRNEILKSFKSLPVFLISIVFVSVLSPRAMADSYAGRSCGSVFGVDKMSVKVFRAVRDSQPRDLDIGYNGSYYVLGLEGLAHERAASHMIVDRLLRPGQDFLFLGVSGKVFTPGIDGTVFSSNVLRPDVRISLKSIQSFKTPEQLASKLVSITRSATAQANKYSEFSNVYGAIFPPLRPSELREWLRRPGQSFFGRVALMAAMGLKAKRAPLKIVFSIEGVRSTDHPNLIPYFLLGMAEYVRYPGPDSVVLMFVDQITELKIGEDY